MNFTYVNLMNFKSECENANSSNRIIFLQSVKSIKRETKKTKVEKHLYRAEG